MKRGMSRFFSILLVLCMVIGMIPMTAQAASTPDTIYFKPNSNWTNDGARFAAYFFGAGESWASMTDSDGDGYYEAKVPSGYTNVIFCRMNPSASANNWNNKWNQSSDLTIPTDGKNCYTLGEGSWDAGSGSWSTRGGNSGGGSSTTTATYYLFGYINGGNYACEEDGANLGSYKFSNGKLTVTFAQDSYVGVKTGDNSTYYMTEGFLGTVKTATLKPTYQLSNPDKFYVPGGIKVTFSVSANSDGSLTLSYSVDASTCQHLVYTNGVCNACGGGCAHSWYNGTCTKCGNTCSHSWSSGKCSSCNMTCSHNWNGNTCTVCKLTCAHNWSEGKCTSCGLTCVHSFKGGSCTKCGSTRSFYLVGYINGGNYACEEDSANMGSYKFTSGKLTVTFAQDSYVYLKTSDNASWYMFKSYVSGKSGTLYNTSTGAQEKMYVPGGVAVTFTLTDYGDDTLKLSYTTSTSSCQHLAHDGNGVCSACGSSVGHNWSGGYCSGCGSYCSHSYSSKITTAATCTTTGVRTYTCSKCANSYTKEIAATGHNFSNGKCTVCGAADSSYSLDYYLFGYINGANYACEEDRENLGSYKFSNGKLTVTFERDSYIGVKTGDNNRWYMAKSYITAKSGTLYNTNTGSTEKMYVPGGVKVTFTLTINGDDTLTISYTTTASSCTHLSHDQNGVCTGCGNTVSHSWSSGYCTVCSLVCTHSSHNQNGTCTTCGGGVSHNYISGTCNICGKTQPVDGVKIHFVDVNVWQNVVVYMWKSDKNGTTNLNSWPGEILNKDANGYFTVDLDYKPVSGESLGFIFHNFNGAQTNDVVIDYATLKSGDVWVKPNNWTNGEGKYECYVTSSESSMYLSPEVDGSTVTFRYENSGATQVSVAGSFNGWSSTANKMTKGDDGFWTTTVTLSEGVYEYKFVVNGSEWVLDPRNGLIGGYDNNSLVIVGNSGSKTSDEITIKLHFYRESGDYSNWDAWMWCDTNSGTGCTLVDDPIYKGKTATLTVSGKGNSYINYLIRKTDWSDQEFYNRTIDLSSIASGTVHFFLNSGSATGSYVYGNDVIKMGKPTYANIDYNSGNIWVKTPLPLTTDPSKSFSLVTSSGAASGITVTGYSLDNNGYSLFLSRKPTLIELHDLRVKCNTMVSINTEGLFYSWGFSNDYTYYGDDLGATWSSKSTTFKVWAPTATGVSVICYAGGNWGGDDWISTTPMTLGSNGVWSVTINGNLHGTYYNYLVSFPGYTTEATDPYARSTGVNGDRGMILDLSTTDPDGWAGDVSPNQGMHYTDAILYEMHIREMTIDASSGVKEEWRGKYLGMAQQGTYYDGRGTGLQHLKELGITHVQIMPMYDFTAVDEYHLTDWQQYAWGYDPKNFNVPEGSYSTDPYHGEVRVNEAKQMIQTFHSNGINVVMDVVYNHAFSGGDFCYNKIVPNYFSRFWGENNWSNGSGVGNDMATERSMCRNFIVDSILYWVEEYHIDGFRFDLAGLIDSQTMNEVISTVHSRHPYVIFYGEGWTGGGGTAVQDNHTLASKENAWSVGSLGFYNDKFRNDIAGDDGRSLGFATGDGGKADDIGNYFRASNGWSSSPSQTVNYVSCHDNYTLIDKIIISRNGAYWDQMVKMNNMSAAIYMLAQGIPFVYSGEELLREKVDTWGNRQHNTYNADDYTTKIRWSDLVNKQYAQLTDDYYSGLINFRKNHAALRCTNGSDAWQYTSYRKINDKCILFYVSGYPNYECSDGIVIIYNANESTQFVNIYDYGVPYGNWQACIHGMTAGVNPLWSTYDGNVGVEGMTTTVLVLGDLIHEESVYNNQVYRCWHGYHNQSGLCWDCGAQVSHYFVNGYCNHCGLAEPANSNMTIYFDNSYTQWDKVYAYAWTAQGARTYSMVGDWPGTQMTHVKNDVYSVSIPRAASSIIFTDNNGNQSIDQGIIKNSNGILTSNIFYASDGTWGIYEETCSHTNHTQTGVCSSCGVAVSHTWSEGVCTVCKMACTHSAHSQSGVCNFCSKNVGHNYYGGVCTMCNAYQQGYIESQDHYLFGYINGNYYGCDWDAGNLGTYKFVNGQLTATFTEDSYVAVKTGDNCSMYMTSGYVGSTNTATLYDSRTVTGDKLFVPGGVKLTFTLKLNTATNTMTLSYVEADNACSHSYTSRVTTAATCTTNGVKTFTCSKCGDSYTETILSTGHSFSGGKCVTCGASQSGSSTSQLDYYLFGYINGANYGCEDDSANLGSYKFNSNGTCNVTFSSDSYVGVKAVTPGTSTVTNWYMTDGWQGVEKTSVTLYDTGSISSADKFYVPGGVALTLTIKVNANGTLTLSYAQQDTSCSHSYTSKVTTAATCTTAGVKTFTCSKCGDSYTETIAATGHSYSGGKCTVCGTTQSGTTSNVTYYIFGYINGANYGCEDDSANLGSYKFNSSGTCSVTFNSDSYVGVKAVDANGEITWYMTDGWQGVDKTSVTLYNTSALNGTADKFYVPGGVTLNITVKNNNDGTLTLSYSQGTGCSHSYTSKVTTAATCTTAGVKTFTCSKCGDSYTETIAPNGHSFSNGKCSVCGAADPNSGSTTSNVTYYIFGYINGANYGCEDDSANLGSYKFVGGNCSTTFSSDSYVGVKAVDAKGEVTWYMTDGWQGVEKTSVTLYNTGSISNPDKFYVPGGKALTITVKANSDGTLTLSYTQGTSCSHSYSSQVTTAAGCTTEGVKTYTCSKCGYFYTETIPATGHSYGSNGLCGNCGLVDPNYQPPSAVGSYTLVSSLSEITSGGKFVIVATKNGSYYAMDDVVTSGKLNGIAVTVSGNTVTGSNLPVWTIAPSGSNVTLTGDGTQLKYGSTANATLWTVKAATGGFTVTSAASTSRGVLFYVSGKTFGAYATSSSTSSYVKTLQFYKYQSGAECEHSYTSKVTTTATCTSTGVKTYTCSYCGDSYTEVIPAGKHGYTEKITTAATCTKTGVKTFTCSGCGDSYTETTPATGHSYADGKCISCGAKDPSTGSNTAYYLFGFINGTDYACGENDAELGSYKFVNGKLKATFNCDSYVGVKTSDNATWYMTDGWQGTDKTSVTLYDATKLSNVDKFYVPGNVELTFTLTENADGSLTLSYSTNVCEHHYVGGSCTLCGAADPNGAGTTKDYYLFGFINGVDYGNGTDDGNLGQYRFVNGKLTTTFTTGSYIAVKTGDNAHWYMTDGWQGADKTSVTLYDTTTLNGTADKFFVPGNVELTFVLTENSDGSINLRYTVSGSSSDGASTVPTINLKYPTVSFEEMVLLNIYYEALNVEDVQEMGLITYDSAVGTASYNTADHVIPGYSWSDSASLYVSSSEGIAAKNLGDTLYFAVYARLKDGTYAYSKLANYSPKTYAYNQLKTGTDAMKKLVVAMLNYGAAAQTKFGYKTNALVNASLTSAQKALVSGYSNSMITAVTQPTASQMGQMTNNGGYIKRYPTVSFEGVFSINYYFQPSDTPVGNIKMYMWTQADFTARTPNKNNATKVYNMTPTGSSGEYLAVVDGIAAKDLDDVVYVSFCYSNGSTEYCSGVVAYSIGQYCRSQASGTGAMAELAKACAVYGYYAKQRFG